LVGLVTASVATAGMVVALALGGGITGMFAVEAVVASVNMIWTTALSRRTLAGLSAQATRSPALRRQAGTFALLMTYSSLLTFIVWRRSELFFLQRYSTHSEIALYSIAFSAMTALVAIPAAISTVISPAVATLFGAGAWERIGRGYGRGLRLLLLATLPLTAGALAVGPALIQVVYGSAYSGTAPILLILLLPLPLIPLVNLGRAFLAGLGRLHFQLAVGTVAAFINFGFDFLLIPAHGAVGAAIANASAQVVAGVPLFLYASRIVGGVRWEIGAIARTAVASAATGLAAWTIVSLVDGAAGVVGGIAAGIAVFLILAKTLRILSPEDAAWLEVVVGGRFGGRLGRTVRGWSIQPAATRG
jgi:O-antigen/teichoic acid export membrane protein